MYRWLLTVLFSATLLSNWGGLQAQDLFLLELKNGETFSVYLGSDPIVLSTGAKELVIRGDQIVDLHVNGCLHGLIKDAKTQHIRPLDLAFVKDKYLILTLAKDFQNMKMPWDKIAHIEKVPDEPLAEAPKQTGKQVGISVSSNSNSNPRTRTLLPRASLGKAGISVVNDDPGEDFDVKELSSYVHDEDESVDNHFIFSTSHGNKQSAGLVYLKEKEIALGDPYPYKSSYQEMLYVTEERVSLPWKQLEIFPFFNTLKQALTFIRVPAFYIDRYPVTNAEYQRFVQATHRSSFPTPAGAEHKPAVNVSYHDAKAYAAWVGKRLPSEVEWSRAYAANPQFYAKNDQVQEWTTSTLSIEPQNSLEKYWNQKHGKNGRLTHFRVVKGEETWPVAENKKHPKIGFRCAKDL